MPTPDSYSAGVDPAHVWTIATTAAPSIKQDGTFLLVNGRYPARIVLPNRLAAMEAEAALRLVGYEVARTGGGVRGRGLTVKGWSAEGLQQRLTAMAGVLMKLAAVPDATAILALEIGRLPAGTLPGPGDQRILTERASQLLRGWISSTSGIHAPRDRRARPADSRCAFDLNLTRFAEESIDQLATQHVRIAALAVALYPSLRQRRSHVAARDIAVRRANLAVRLSQHRAQSASPANKSGQAPSPAALPIPLAESPKPSPGTDSDAKPRSTREFPAADNPISPTAQPPYAPGVTSPRGRNFPSGRADRRLR